VLSLALMVGAVINSLRFEYHDTGEIPYHSPRPCTGCEEKDSNQLRASSSGNKQS